MNLEVHGVTTERENDGLAMSSRNGYLTAEQRQLAPLLYRCISELADNIVAGRRDFRRLISDAKSELAKQGFKPDYIEIRAAESLLHPSHEDDILVILAAAFLGKTRLIDNIQLQLDE